MLREFDYLARDSLSPHLLGRRRGSMDHSFRELYDLLDQFRSDAVTHDPWLPTACRGYVAESVLETSGEQTASRHTGSVPRDNILLCQRC